MRTKVNKVDDLVYTALIARGYRGEELEHQYLSLKKKGVTADQLIKEFIETADRDPKCINAIKCGNGCNCGGCVNRNKV